MTIKTCLSLRVDIISDVELLIVLEYFKNKLNSIIKKLLVYEEKDPKRHIHIRYETSLTKSSCYNKWNKFLETLWGIHYTHLPLSQRAIKYRHLHAHHVIWQQIKGKLVKCQSHPQCKTGSFTYIAKNCKLLINEGYSKEFILIIQEEGARRLALSKKNIVEKIILLNSLNSQSSGEKISKSIIDYYKLIEKPPKAPRAMKALVHNIKVKLNWLDYNSYYYKQLTFYIQQDPSNILFFE